MLKTILIWLFALWLVGWLLFGTALLHIKLLDYLTACWRAYKDDTDVK